MDEVTSKHIDGITDLVVVAPIKEGFIKAFEAITYGTRLKLVAEALNRVRVSTREYERIQPFTDVTERILNLLDFRIGVLDKDMFGLAKNDRKRGERPDDLGQHLEPRRYLYLTATFEGGWEPYMRLIWKPLGAFLDLLFCNCEGYVTASEHSCEEYLQWVRDNQMDSAIFYNTTGLTTRDQKYLAHLEKRQRAGDDDLKLAALTMPYPDDESGKTRAKFCIKTVELALEALTVLYKLADYYPPEWMTGNVGERETDSEGHRLVRVAAEILRGFDDVLLRFESLAEQVTTGQTLQPPLMAVAQRWLIARKIYADPINWYRTGQADLVRRDQAAEAKRVADPDFVRGEIQAGIIKSIGSSTAPVRRGALLMFTIHDAAGARAFIKELMDQNQISFERDKGTATGPGLFLTIAFTSQGLLHLGMERSVHDRLPKEFREGPARRSGLMGDMRENHPRNWILPDRNGPIFTGAVPAGTRLPPVDLDEVDFTIQLRSTADDLAAIEDAVRSLAARSGKAASLEAIDWLHIEYDGATDLFKDHFGYLDGISQPKPFLPDEDNDPDVAARNGVKLGEVILGYANDRGDAAPGDFDTLDGPGEKTHWRQKNRTAALALQKDGSFLVIRKIGEDVSAFDTWLDQQAFEVNTKIGCGLEKARALLKAAVMGRDESGAPLAKPNAATRNDFDYGGDQQGLRCPHAAHIRLANPRRTERNAAFPELRAEFDRPTPRLVRRGMLFGQKTDASRGLMFMAYNTSIAEQFETVQRWLNGGNSSDIASAHNDPLTGVMPREGQDCFRFVAQRSAPGGVEDVVVRVKLPLAKTPEDRNDEPGRHPFAPLYWGLYLFAPSRTAINMMTGWKGRYLPLDEALEKAVGDAWLKRVGALSQEEAGKEWKRVLEDFDTKDPTQADISPSLWAAIRLYIGGVINLREGAEVGSGPMPPPFSVARAGAGTIPEKSAHLMGVADTQVADLEAAANMRPQDPHDWDKPDWKTQNVIICAGYRQVMQVLADWENFTSEEQLRRIIDKAGPIYVTQQPDDVYIKLDPTYKGTALNYHQESLATNTALYEYSEEDSFDAGYEAGKAVLAKAKLAVERSNAAGAKGKRDYFKMELRRQFIQPAIAEVWKHWYGLPDGIAMAEGSWSWKRVVKEISEADPDTLARTMALCPGDFMAPSRGSVFPRPGSEIQHFAASHGTAILDAGRKFVHRLRTDHTVPRTPLAQRLFEETQDDEVLARNLIGTMIGAIPPMDANLRNIILDWLLEKSLWRHQAAMKRALAGKPVESGVAEVREILRGPISRAMCKRPAPDLLFRTAKGKATIERYSEANTDGKLQDVETQEGDLIITCLASASQRTLFDRNTPDGDVSVIFGGKRTEALQGYKYEDGEVKPDPQASIYRPVHACPAQKMAMGAMTGILAALLDAGTIQALPASLIVKISDW